MTIRPRPYVPGALILAALSALAGARWAGRPRLIPTTVDLPPVPDQARVRGCGNDPLPEPREDDPRYQISAGTIVVDPVPFGPRVAQQPFPSRARNRKDLTQKIGLLNLNLNPCYSAARAHDPALAGRIDGTLSIDEWGRIDSVALRANAKLQGVARCFERELVGILIDERFVPRMTQVTVRFELSHGERHENTGSRESLPHEPLSYCVLRPAHVPVDTWPVPYKILIDDSTVDVVPGTSDNFSAVARAAQRRVQDNLGAYRACFAASSAEEGWRNLTVDFDPTGVARRVTGDTQGELGGCLARALSELWIESGLPWKVSVHFKRGTAPAPRRELMARAPLAEVERLVAEAISEGDGERALRHLGALLIAAPGHARACIWRAEQLRAALLAAPWGDARFDDTLAGLARQLSDHPDDPSAPLCLADVQPTLDSWLAREEDTERTERLLSLLPQLPSRRALERTTR